MDVVGKGGNVSLLFEDNLSWYLDEGTDHVLSHVGYFLFGSFVLVYGLSLMILHGPSGFFLS